MDRIIQKSLSLEVPLDITYQLFVEKKHLEQWLTEEANIELKVGGAYELFWVPEEKEFNSTAGCKILAFKMNEFLNFEWKGPKQFHGFMNKRDPLTNVSVFFVRDNEKKTIIHLLHTGWESTKQWDEAYDYFDNAWTMAVEKLKSYSSKLQVDEIDCNH